MGGRSARIVFAGVSRSDPLNGFAHATDKRSWFRPEKQVNQDDIQFHDWKR